MLGDENNPCLHAKGAESRGMLKPTVELLKKYKDSVPGRDSTNTEIKTVVLKALQVQVSTERAKTSEVG